MMKVKKIAVTSVMVFMLVVSSGEVAAGAASASGGMGLSSKAGLGLAGGAAVLAAYNYLASQHAKRAGSVADIEQSSGDLSARFSAFTGALSDATSAFAPDAPVAQMSAFRKSVDSAHERVEEWFAFREKIFVALENVRAKIDTAREDKRFSPYQRAELNLFDNEINKLTESLNSCKPSDVPVRDVVDPTYGRRGSFSSYGDIPRNPSSTGRRGSFSYGETPRNPSPRRRDRLPRDPLVAAESRPERGAVLDTEGVRVWPSKKPEDRAERRSRRHV